MQVTADRPIDAAGHAQGKVEPARDGETRFLDPDDAAARENRARRARLRLALAMAILASSVVLIAIGAGTYDAVDRSVRSLREATLRSILEAQSKTIGIWIQDQTVGIRRLARDHQVREHVAALAAIAARPGTTPEEYCAAPMRRPLVAELDDAFTGTGAVGFNIIDRSGRIIASSFREYCGLRLRSELLDREFVPVFQGKTIFVRPSHDAERLEQPPHTLPLSRPVVWVETPVVDGAGRVIAALAVGQYADEEFAEILAAARSGDTAEVYAFDQRGKMLSESRFTPGLIGNGVLAAGKGTTLTLTLRPPEGGEDVLTALAEAALTGSANGKLDGMLLEPYPGYYGKDVIGAWRWLPAADLAIAVEISADEAYAPLRVLRVAFGIVFSALVIAVVAALASWFSAAQLRRRISEERRLGPYVLGDRIGEGGVANVYLATHELLKRPTAVKLLKPARATDEMVARFEREALLASQLSHPNMVEIFDYGRASGGVLYYAMEYLEGSTVGAIVLRLGAMPVARAVHLLRQICAGLAEAHGKGLVHRDVSATNVMVCRYGGEYDFVKILDFGLVKSVAREQSEIITRTLRLLGTPVYMAPERLRDPADVDARADIYAVGAVAFFMLCGRQIFTATDELALTSCVLNETPPRLKTTAQQPVPDALDDLVAACLAKRREDRPQSVAEVIRVLDAVARSAPWTQHDAESAWQALQSAPPVSTTSREQPAPAQSAH